MSLAHFERTGEVPLLFFRHTGEEASPDGQSSIESQHLCAAGRGEMLAVDVDGEVYPCITLAGSCQTITSSALLECVEAMRLGSLTGRQFWDRYHRLPEVARGLGVFAPKESRRSSYRRCRDCPYLAQCFVCPTSIGHIQADENCERVPDFICAFNFTALKYRERFLEQAQARRYPA